VFTARYALSPYIKQIHFIFKGLIFTPRASRCIKLLAIFFKRTLYICYQNVGYVSLLITTETAGVSSQNVYEHHSIGDNVNIFLQVIPFLSCAATAQLGPRPPHCRGYCISHTQSHTQPVGLLWASDQLDAETFTWQNTTPTRDRHQGPRGIRTRYPSKRKATDPPLDLILWITTLQKSEVTATKAQILMH
jgi:hypothetical protein